MKFHGLKKAAAFWAAYWGILAVYGATLLADAEGARGIATAVVAALVALSGVSQGWNVADNLQRSKNYRDELADKAGKE